MRESNSTNLQIWLVQMTCEFISLSRPRNFGIDLTILIELKLILDEKAYLFYSLLQYQGSNDSVIKAFRRPNFKSWLDLNVVSYAVTSSGGRI